MDVDGARETAGAPRGFLFKKVLACWPAAGDSFPRPVLTNRFAAVLEVFILGMNCLLGGARSGRTVDRPAPYAVG